MKNLLDNIDKANDIKKISKENLPALGKDIRQFLLENISKNGGHLASNLGVVELTMALHYALDMDRDKIVWDVGHQAYTHKILTGRKEGFSRLRGIDGLSGFPKPSESKHDAFATGHSSTSISAALGMAVARDLRGSDEKIVAVIGDGSMTGGLAFEGLNNAGRRDTKLLVILNDNQMSISDNVGAVSRHLNDIRTAPAYLQAKAQVHKALDKVPVVGKSIDKGIEKFKDGIKHLLVSGGIFEELGFNYVGPVNGHNINELIDVINGAKEMKGPVLLHVVTTKGKGYKFAEKFPGEYHGVGSFDIKTGNPTKNSGVSYSKIFGDTMAHLGKVNKKVVGISAAMAMGTGLDEFQKKYPNRFFDVAIAEQHAVTFAAGLAIEGYIPVFAVYSSFFQRAYDQILEDVCFQNLHVIFAIDRAGIVGSDGETHQGIFDISFLSHIPNLTIMAPGTGAELKNMLNLAINCQGPVAIRYPRSGAEEDWDKDVLIEIGVSKTIKEGEGVAVISCGAMLETAKKVCDRLEADGVSPMLVDTRFIKPMDYNMIDTVCSKCTHIFTIEDNVLIGGFGEGIKVAVDGRTSVTTFGFPDKFIEQGTREELFARYELDSGGIYNKIKKALAER